MTYSARMSAKQCLRHPWLRAAPTQAAPHLRRYLSKSREVLLERVVSRENLRRAALLSSATSQANLTENEAALSLVGGLSQSEMCLSYTLTGSRGSLTNSECYLSPADSQSSLNSSQTSLATSQNYLLNKEQTQGLLNQAQSRSQANLNHVTRRGLLSRMRSLNQIQSQACLLPGKNSTTAEQLNPLFGSRSQEKLYGLKCLSKSQGVLDIYRSLESIRNTKKKWKDTRAITEGILPISKQLKADIGSLERSGSAGVVMDSHTEPITNLKVTKNNDEPLEVVEKNCPEPKIKTDELEIKNEKELKIDDKNVQMEYEEHLDSLQSVESDTLTEDSDETALDLTRLTVKQPCTRQHSDISSHSNNSVNSDEKDEHSESEHDEPKYTVAQLVSAFNKHQEVASQTSLEAIMTEKRVNEVTFPTGPKALRLFIPDINITERGIVRRKTSYKPRKNWEELRKQNEKNEAVLKDLEHDSGNEDDEESTKDHCEASDDEKKFFFDNSKDNWSCETFPDQIEDRIDEKYKQCVQGAQSGQHNVEKSDEKMKFYSPRSSYDKERLPNYIYPEVIAENIDKKRPENSKKLPKTSNKTKKLNTDSSVNLKDILQKDSSQAVQEKNLEKLRKRTSITKIIVNDNMSMDDTNNNGYLRAKSEPPTTINGVYPEDGTSEYGGRSGGQDGGHEAGKLERKRAMMTPEERKIWGKVCTGTYGRAMEKFNGKKQEGRKNLITELTRRKSSPTLPPSGC